MQKIEELKKIGFKSENTGAEGNAFSCKLCQDKKYIKVLINSYEYVKRCDCTYSLSNVSEIGIPEKYRQCGIKNYIPSTQTQKNALEIAKIFVERFRVDRKGLLFEGTTGTGKTHLASAIANNLFLKKVSSVRFYELRGLLEQIKLTYSNKNLSESEIMDDVCTSSLLVLDDVGAERLNDWTADVLSTVINRRYNSNKPLIITTNLSSNDGSLTERIGIRNNSRLKEMCDIIAIFGKDYRG